LRIAALVAAVAIAGCQGSSLEQTPLPPDQPQTAQGQGVPISRTSPDDAPNDNDLGAPVSEGQPPSAAGGRPLETRAARAPQGDTEVKYVCRHPALAGHRECDAVAVLNANASRVATSGGCNKSAPYCAADLQAAYGVSQAAKSGGKGATVAIVDAYGYPNAASDLAVYRKSMGLPNCTVSQRCLRIVNQYARTAPLPKPNADPSDDWRAEEALDLDVISAICPNCRIVLVEANSDKDADLGAAVNAAVALGAAAVSNGYSGGEERAREAAYQHAGRVLTASAGNDGAGAKAPCSYAGVVCVGGTSLLAGSNGRGWSERAWSGTGSGCSAYVAKPSWQHTKLCVTRSDVDVAAVADPATGVAVYESAGGGWQQFGGTSVGAAIVAALFTLGPSAARANAPQWIWRHGPTAYRQVDGSKSYDAATGWGTPNGVRGF